MPLIEQTGCIRHENIERGLMAIDIPPKPLRFGRMKYSGDLRLWVSDCILDLRDFISFQTKKDAVKYAHDLGWTANHVEKIGSRFWSCWGIRHDVRDNYFLATYE